MAQWLSFILMVSCAFYCGDDAGVHFVIIKKNKFSASPAPARVFSVCALIGKVFLLWAAWVFDVSFDRSNCHGMSLLHSVHNFVNIFFIYRAGGFACP